MSVQASVHGLVQSGLDYIGSLRAHLEESTRSVGSLKDDGLSLRVYLCSLSLYIAASVLNTSLFSTVLDGTPMTFVRYACVLGIIVAEFMSGRHTVRSLLLSLLPAVLFVLPILPMSAVAYYVATWLCLSEILCRGVSKERVIALVAVSSLAVCSFAAHSPSLLDTTLLVWAARNRDMRIVGVVVTIVLSLTFCTVMVFCAMGYLDNYHIDYATRMRWSLGFRYPLYPAMLGFTITQLICWLRGDKLGVLDVIALVGVNVLILQLTDSRLSFLCSMGAVAGAIFIRVVRAFGKRVVAFEWMMVGSFIIAAVVSIAVTMLYAPSIGIMKTLNKVLTERLVYGQNALINHGTPFFGQPVEFIGQGLDADGVKQVGTVNYVDCLFVKLLVKYGLIGFAAFMTLLTHACVRVWKACDMYLLYALAFVAVHAMVDDLALYIYFDPFLLAVTCFIAPVGHSARQEVES